METSTRKHTKFMAAAVGSMFLLASIATLHSEDTKSTKKKSAKATTETKAETKDAKKKPAGRLPNNYGKLDLTDAQRDQIYAIQGKTSDQIDSLRKQLKALEDKRDQEVEGVLTAAQKTKLKELTAENDGKRKGRGGLRINEKAAAQKKASEPATTTTEKKK